MSYVHIFSILFFAIGIYLYFGVFSERQKIDERPFYKDGAFWGMLLACLFIKIYLAGSYMGFETDINCFSSWSKGIVSGSFGEFYKGTVEGGMWPDYPPGYICVLYVVGFLRNLFSPEHLGAFDLILLKLPAVLCDMGAGVLLYSMAKKKFSRVSGFLLMALYLLNPAVVVNSSSWGQVDGVLALGILLSIYLATEKKLPLAYFVFVISVLLKWQALIFTPVLIYATISEVFLPKFDAKRLGKLALSFVGSVAVFFLVSLPFGVEKVFKVMFSALSSYRHVTVNAFNTYAAADLNWKGLDQYPFLAIWGTVAIFLLVAFSAFLYYKKDVMVPQAEDKDPTRFYFIGATIILCMFMLSTKMHERYLFPILALMLAVYMINPKKEFYFLYLALSLGQTYNIAYVLFYYDSKTYWDTIDRFYAYSMPVSYLMIGVFLAFLYVSYKYYIKAPVKGKKYRR